MHVFSAENQGMSPDAANEGLSSLVYKSRAAQAFTEDALNELVAKAQVRNRAENITGAVYYENGHFLQWLEGPPSSIYRVADSIGRDPRHTDIQLLSFGHSSTRLFSDWDMRLIVKQGAMPSPFVHIETQPAPSAAASGSPAPGLSASSLAVDTALKLAAGSDAEALALLNRAGPETADHVRCCEAVINSYVSLWASDKCHDADITLGLCKLLSAFRKHRHGSRLDLCIDNPPVLVALCPDEPHHIGVALASELLMEDNHAVDYVFPKSNEAIFDRLSLNTYKGLVLVSSGVFSRDHLADRVKATAQGARQRAGADLNIVLYGRMAARPPEAIAHSCIHHCCCSATEIPPLFRGARNLLH